MDFGLRRCGLTASALMGQAGLGLQAASTETVLRVLSAYKPQVKNSHIDLAKTYTNAFVEKARAGQ